MVILSMVISKGGMKNGEMTTSKIINDDMINGERINGEINGLHNLQATGSLTPAKTQL